MGMHLAPTTFASVQRYFLQNVGNLNLLCCWSKNITICYPTSIHTRGYLCTLRKMLRSILLLTDSTGQVSSMLCSVVGFAGICSGTKLEQ